jgi:hypothetical protein
MAKVWALLGAKGLAEFIRRVIFNAAIGNADSPRILGETRQYIRDFERLAMQTTMARELYDQMLKLYPDWGNRGALWTSVRAIKT